jgi:ubiquinone/menaquinone biosynthesis C-methylase UbiE
MVMKCRRLQRNFDVIQYLVRDASAEQLVWRKNEDSQSLREVLCHLRDVEKWHAWVSMPHLDRDRLFSSSGNRFSEEITSLNANGEDPFMAYARYRQKTVTLLEGIPPADSQCIARHELFGDVTVAELVERINETDRTYICQIEDIIHNMPLNPIFRRALAEINDYHQRYQPYLTPVTSLLDIGVGSGLALQYVIQQNPHLSCTGVDIRDLRLGEVVVPLQVYDGYTLPFAADQFDVSLIFYVMHHCDDPGRLLQEAVRVTRQKLIIIEEFHQPGADPISLDLTERQSHRALGIPANMPYRLLAKAEFDRLLEQHHLTLVEQQQLPSKTTRPVQKYLYVLQVTG